jgi:hypothetical protein
MGPCCTGASVEPVFQQKGFKCGGVSGSFVNRVHEMNRVRGGGPFTPGLLHAPQSAYRMGCLAVWPPTRIEGRLGPEGPTHHAATSTQPMQSPSEEYEASTSERGECSIQKALRRLPGE